MMLRARRLTKRFGAVTALDGVDFDLRPGEIHALCGENGAGKSTLIKLLSGVHPAGSYAGTIEVAGREARFRSIRDAAAAGIAVIHQELAVIDTLDVADNIVLGHEPRYGGFWLDRRSARSRAARLLERFAVPLEPDTPMHGLGVGQKQLVEILKALARESRILILDEPTAALAQHEVAVLLKILADLRRGGVSCIYISHRLTEVLELSDRVTVLRDGATVCTLDTASADEATLVRHMVGREINSLYARPAAADGAPGRRAASGAAPVLSVEALCVADEEGGVRLEDIGLELRAGEVLGIGGLMGAGRSELLMHLFGAWGVRRAGRVVLDGRVLPDRDPRAVLEAGMALVSEDRRRFGLILGQSIGFNLSLSSLDRLSRCGVIDGRREADADRHWFDELGIRAAGVAAMVGRLSGGNQQKVVLGRVLMRRPKVVLLDEPTRGIDIGAKLEIYTLIRRLTADGCAVLLVSSELPELIGLADRIVMLRGGRLGRTFEGGEATQEALMLEALGQHLGNGSEREVYKTVQVGIRPRC